MNPTRTRLPAALAAATAVAALTLLSGCSSSGSDGGDSAGTADAAIAAEEPADLGAAQARDALADDAAGAESALQSTADDGADTAKDVDPSRDAARVAPGTSVIRTGTVSLEADDVEETRFDVRKVVDKYRGTITEQETTTGDEGEMSTARLVIRVPSASFEDATRDLEAVATLLSSNTAGEDVSTEVIDVDARIRAQRASVSRVEALLDQATNLQQVISIERQLASRQADLDSLVARQKYLADQTALSTITVTVEQPDEDEPKKKKDDDDTGFLSGLEDGWDSFVDGLVVALTVLGFLLPWLILVAVLGAPAWLALRRRAGRRPAPPAPAAP